MPKSRGYSRFDNRNALNERQLKAFEAMHRNPEYSNDDIRTRFGLGLAAFQEIAKSLGLPPRVRKIR